MLPILNLMQYNLSQYKAAAIKIRHEATKVQPVSPAVIIHLKGNQK